MHSAKGSAEGSLKRSAPFLANLGKELGVAKLSADSSAAYEAAIKLGAAPQSSTVAGIHFSQLNQIGMVDSGSSAAMRFVLMFLAHLEQLTVTSFCEGPADAA